MKKLCIFEDLSFFGLYKVAKILYMGEKIGYGWGEEKWKKWRDMPFIQNN